MRRSAILAVLAAASVLAGCQSPRAQTSGATRLSQPTLSSPMRVVKPGHPIDSRRYLLYDQF